MRWWARRPPSTHRPRRRPGAIEGAGSAQEGDRTQGGKPSLRQGHHRLAEGWACVANRLQDRLQRPHVAALVRAGLLGAREDAHVRAQAHHARRGSRVVRARREGQHVRQVGVVKRFGLAHVADQPGAAANGIFPTPHEPSWRLDVGERVACKMGEDTWLPGTVELRDEPDPEAYPGFALLPYVVRIDDGFRMVSAARDNDAFILAERDMPVAAEGE